MSCLLFFFPDHSSLQFGSIYNGKAEHSLFLKCHQGILSSVQIFKEIIRHAILTQFVHDVPEMP